MQAAKKALLLYDTQGTKFDGSVVSAVKKLLPKVPSYSTNHVLRGELLESYEQADQPFNYRLCRDPGIFVFCEADNVAPLGEGDFRLLEPLSHPADRLEVFRHKMEWGMTLGEGSKVFVTLPGDNLSAPKIARATVHYRGKIGTQSGTYFGVEILDKSYRLSKVGTTDGTFQGLRYFTCPDNCGLFVTIRWLSASDAATATMDNRRVDELKPTYSEITGGPSQGTRSKSRPPMAKAASIDGSSSLPHHPQGTPSYTKSASRDDAISSSKAKGKTSESSVDPAPPRFVVGQHVMFYDKNGDKHYGTVKWSGRKTRTRSFEYPVVGIKTDDDIFKSDYERSIPGLDYLMSAPKRHALFLPEAFVEDIPSEVQQSGSSSHPARSDSEHEIAKALNMSHNSLMKQQVELLDKAEKDKTAKEDEASLKALEVSEESIDITKQADYYKKLQSESVAQGHVQVQDDQCQLTNVDVSRQQEEMRRYEADKKANSAGDGLGDRMGDSKYPDTGRRPSSHIYDEPNPPPSPSSRHRHIHQQHLDVNPALDHWAAHDQETGQRGYQNSRHPTYGQQPGYYEQDPGYQQSRDQYLHDQQPPPQHMRQDFPPGQNQTIPSTGHDPRSNLPGENRDFSQAQVSQSSQGLPPGAQGHPSSAQRPPAQGPPPGADGQSAVPLPVFAASTGPPGEDLSHGLGVGSLIQIPGADGHSVKYGTIKWIGLVPNAQGKIAGIELEEPMDGCTDGTFQGTGQQFFNCPHGMGLYYPLKNLQPDHRWAPQVAADGNPLRKVRSEELDTPAPGNLDMYIGDERGIQGHQNSCYLDATLFGLFAISDEFDAMFLNEKSDIGNTLWRNIVNPLRKNGVVKYECVMRLREQLDQLGQMKGITQDEKDPEEFLNLMFKHTLHVPPFISIRRPFGVENEYFVQLFSEMDGSKEPPSIGNLLEKMFLEQKISFTKVPSKLLIQVPRFGKKFQTFQKIIPAKIINVASIVDVSSKCFFCGEENARRQCPDCQVEFQCDATYCDRCLGLAHQKRPNHNQVGLTKDAFHLKTLADLELLSVICIETSHYVCFTRQEDRWIFFDSMANRVYDKYNIPKVDNCTRDLNSWVYPPDGDLSRLLNTPPRELPEYVRRFTQDIYMCVYIQPDVSMYN